MIFDIIVLCIIGISAVIACLRGFIREMLTVTGVVGGTVAAYVFGAKLSPAFLDWFGGEKGAYLFGMIPPKLAADVCGYGAIFLVVVTLLSVASHLLSGWAKAIGLGAVDRTFGVLFGVVRGAVVILLLYLPLYMVFDEDTRKEWFKDSKTQQYAEMGAAWAKGFVPEGAADELKKKAEKTADKTAEKAAQAARDRLLNAEGMREGNDPVQPGALPPAEDGAPAQGTPDAGYETQERRDMNELFMDNVND